MHRCLSVVRSLWGLVVLLAAPGLAGSFNRVPSTPAMAVPAVSDAGAPAGGSSPGADSEVARPAVAPPAAPETSAAAGDPRAASEDATAEPDARPEGEPTYGGACVYGPRGVLYAPAGKDCTRAATAPSSAEADAVPREGAASCVFGLHGELLHAPPGVRCARLRQSSPVRPDAPPRVRRYRP